MRQMAHDSIATHVLAILEDRIKEGDILFARKDEKLIHAFIWSPNPKNIKQNIIHCNLMGLVYGNLKDWIKSRLFEVWSLEIVRLNHGKAISDQAKRWVSSASILNVRNMYVYSYYNHYELFVSLIIKHQNSLLDKTQVKKFENLQEMLSHEDVAFLELCKYAIRRSTRPTLNAGLICSSFVFLCITIPLISNHIPESKSKFPPTLKYGNETKSLFSIPTKYSRAIEWIRTERPKLPNPSILSQILNLEEPRMASLVDFVPQLEAHHRYSRIPIRTYENDCKETKKDKGQQSVIEFLKNNGIENLDKLHAQFKEILKSLASINPKVMNIELLYYSLEKFRKETDATYSVTFDLKSLAYRICHQLALKSAIVAGALGVGLFTLYKRSSSFQASAPSLQNRI